MTIRTRVAPSPTGDPHVGTAYVALFNYCLAKQSGGQFILRIEDTDQARSTEDSEVSIMKALRWLGLDWDEGPDVGGPCGPYRQSERGDIYRAHVQQLLDNGHAFKCFLSTEELQELRTSHQKSGGLGAFDSPHADLTPAQEQAFLDADTPYVIRMRVPREGDCLFRDQLRGEISIPWQQVDMQILLKSDGMPTYHLANVVDDHLMGITHVLRGEEWISSAPKHQLLYAYFGWEMPTLCHLPLLRNPDRSKLSKRKNPTSILYYERMGYLPEALLNYLGRMAWSMPDESEQFSLATMLKAFTLDRISLGGPVFDVAKLDWLNGTWIRETLDDNAFADRVSQWALNRDHLTPLIPLVRQRVQKWSDLAEILGFFLQGRLNLTKEDLIFKGLDEDTTRRVYAYTLWSLDNLPTWDSASIEACLREMSARMELKLRVFLAPFFVAITAKTSATPLFDTLALLGKDLTRVRIRDAIDAIKPISGKEAKKWDKDYRQVMTRSLTESTQ
jgi:glutamyl-tRNA synthetase